jgi:hypothetical protein
VAPARPHRLVHLNTTHGISRLSVRIGVVGAGFSRRGRTEFGFRRGGGAARTHEDVIECHVSTTVRLHKSVFKIEQ